jgi:hypothetical protein
MLFQRRLFGRAELRNQKTVILMTYLKISYEDNIVNGHNITAIIVELFLVTR